MSDGRDDDDALRTSDARFRLAVETLGEGVVITDAEDVIVYVNSRMAEISGYAPRGDGRASAVSRAARPRGGPGRLPPAHGRCACRACPSSTR